MKLENFRKYVAYGMCMGFVEILQELSSYQLLVGYLFENLGKEVGGRVTQGG